MFQPGFLKFRLFRSTLGVSALGAALLRAASSHAGLFDDDEARRAILELQPRVEALENQLSNAPRALLDQSNQIEQLRQQVAELRGQIETLGYQFSTMQQEIRNSSAALDQNLKSTESLQRPVDEIQGKAQPDETEAFAFNTALRYFQEKNFQRAGALFKSFIAKYPNSPHQPTAQYWLGNALYAQRQYGTAAAVLDRLVKQYPAHPRAPEALLAIAQIQLEQGQKGAARKTLQQIIGQYANTEAAQSARRQLNQPF